MTEHNPYLGKRAKVNWDAFDRGMTGEVGVCVDGHYSSIVGWAVTIEMGDGKRYGFPPMSLEWLEANERGLYD